MRTSESDTEFTDFSITKEENDQLLKSFDTPEPDSIHNADTSRGVSHKLEEGGVDEDDDNDEFEDASSPDDRLLFITEDQQNRESEHSRGGAASEIDRNIHNAITEGSSSGHYVDNLASSSTSAANQHNANSPSSTSPNHDLESQLPRGRLTTKQRIWKVIHSIVPVKQTYERINNGLTTGRMQANLPGNFVGQGTDGVFRNLMAKPDTESNRLEVETHPPTYDEAAADATPEYWESTVISPMYEDEVFVEGLPVGNVANFIWNALVSVAFQFVGFILCYLLHTSHAAKQGSRAGLGITFIIYAYSMIPNNYGHANSLPDRIEPDDANLFDVDKGTSISKGGKIDQYNSGLFQQHAEEASDLYENKTPYFAYGVIAFGLFLILKALVDYWRVKQIERVILSPPGGQFVETHTLTSNADGEIEGGPHNDSEDSDHRLHRISDDEDDGVEV